MDNFYKTAVRNFKSSQTLHSNSEFFNSCYLGGYVVECYSKMIIKAAYGSEGSELKSFMHDLKRTTREIDYLVGDPSASGLVDTRYLLDLKSQCGTIIAGQNKWDPIKRYYNDESIWNSSASSAYQRAIDIVMQTITTMKIDGII